MNIPAKRGSLVVTRGLPASGKTTWAKALVRRDPVNRVRLSRDDLRSMLYGVRHGLPPGGEDLVSRVMLASAKDALARGKHVVVDATHLRSRDLRSWLAVDPAAWVVDFEVDIEEAVRRDALRDHSVGEEVIRSLADRFLKKGKLPTFERPDYGIVPRPYVADESLDQAYLFDIDGTLAHIVPGGRSPYDGTRVGEDSLDPAVASLLNYLEPAFQIVLVSGRSEEYRAQTEEWLKRNGVLYDALHMRPAGDTRKDDVVKAELFDRHIRDRYWVQGVFDDRKRVVDMWRTLGLKCFQVQDGDF